MIRRPVILFTIPNFDTAGSGKALLNLATGLRAIGFEVIICCNHDKGTLFESVRSLKFKYYLYPYVVDMSNRFKGLMNVVKVASFFRRLSPDIIHSFHYGSDYSEALAARLAGLKWIYTKKSMSWGGYSKNSWRLRSALASGIIAQNTDMLKLFFKDSKKTSLISRGVNHMQYTPASGEEKHALKLKLRLSANSRYVVCVANLVPVKGIEILLDAFDRIKERHPNSSLLIVGDYQSDYGKILYQKAGEISKDRIFFTGKVLNVKEYLQISTVFVLPTLNQGRQEGSPVSLLEAMATGIPVLASDVAGIRDQLVRYPAALFEPGNSEALAEKLATILRLPELELEEMGMQFRAEVVKYFTLTQEVEQHVRFYSRLLGK